MSNPQRCRICSRTEPEIFIPGSGSGICLGCYHGYGLLSEEAVGLLLDRIEALEQQSEEQRHDGSKQT